MTQYTTNNKIIDLQVLSGHLLFVDPLYFQDIVDNYDQIKDFDTQDKRLFIKAIEEKLFPYGGGGLLGYKSIDTKSNSFSLNPSLLKKFIPIDDAQTELVISKRTTTFGLDTGSFLIIDLQNIDSLVQLIKYDEIIDALLSKQLDNYIETINTKLGNKGWAYMVSAGDTTNNEFDGDGSYTLE